MFRIRCICGDGLSRSRHDGDPPRVLARGTPLRARRQHAAQKKLTTTASPRRFVRHEEVIDETSALMHTAAAAPRTDRCALPRPDPKRCSHASSGSQRRMVDPSRGTPRLADRRLSGQGPPSWPTAHPGRRLVTERGTRACERPFPDADRPFPPVRGRMEPAGRGTGARERGGHWWSGSSACRVRMPRGRLRTVHERNGSRRDVHPRRRRRVGLPALAAGRTSSLMARGRQSRVRIARAAQQRVKYRANR